MPGVRRHGCQLPGWRGLCPQRRKRRQHSGFRLHSSGVLLTCTFTFDHGPPEPRAGAQNHCQDERSLTAAMLGTRRLDWSARECVSERCRCRVTVKGGKEKRAGGGVEARPVTSLGPQSLRARRTLRLEGQPTGSFSWSGEFQGALLESACHPSPLAALYLSGAPVSAFPMVPDKYWPSVREAQEGLLQGFYFSHAVPGTGVISFTCDNSCKASGSIINK